MRHPDSEPALLTSVKPFLRDACTLGVERKIIALKIRALGQAWRTQIYSGIIDVVSVSSDCVDTVFEGGIARSVSLLPRGFETQVQVDG